MKITVNFDCTPEEARDFLGLADIKPLQEAFLAGVQDKIASGLSPEDMEKMLNIWAQPDIKQMGQNMAALQDIFWNIAQSGKK